MKSQIFMYCIYLEKKIKNIENISMMKLSCILYFQNINYVFLKVRLKCQTTICDCNTLFPVY